MSLVEIRGEVLRVEARSGSKLDQKTGQYNDWAMTIVTVLVARKGTTEVILPRNLAVIDGFVPVEGDTVSFLADVVRSERGFNLNIIGNTPGWLEERTASAYAGSTS